MLLDNPVSLENHVIKAGIAIFLTLKFFPSQLLYFQNPVALHFSLESVGALGCTEWLKRGERG